ncbi:CDC27 family protein [Pseudanabaena sp. UWO310]|uniref:CDC27 family protein n=1 Tax=Pseudanabaena sp. UWO310 TaxID=2480795 RepID=UPI0011599004|nr:CDC27 family protein [Pseudanabaena sp. UWO310]TYQ30303.1 histidine kinase [Pseudanabaena sp. UWO310]
MSDSTSQGVNKIDASSEVVNSSEVEKAMGLSKQAWEFANAGKLEEAIYLFEQSLNIDTQSVYIVNRYTTFLIRNNYYQEAKKIFQDFLIKYPNTIDILVKYANFLLDLNEVDSALTLFVDILKTDPKNILVLVNYAEIAYKAKKYDLTCSLCEIILSKDNKNWLIRNIYANSLAIQGCKEKAYSVFSSSLLLLADQQFEQPKKTTLRSKYTKLLTDYIEALFLNENKDEITNVFSCCFSHELFSNSLKSGYGSMKMSFLSSFIKEIRLRNIYKNLAKIFLNFWINENPTNSTILINYLDYVLQAKKPDRNKFFEIYEIWLEIEPNNIDILTVYANSLANDNKRERALELFEKIYRLDFNNIAITNEYINTLLVCNCEKKALDIVENLLGIVSVTNKNIYKFADLFLEKNKCNEAIILFEKISNKNKTNIIQSLIDYINYLIKNNNFESTIFLFEYLLNLEDKNTYILYRYASVLLQCEDYKKAYDIFDRYLEIDKYNISILNQYANALVKQGSYAKALELFSFSLELDDRDVRTLTCYANALFKVGEYEKSLHILEINIQLEPYNIITLTNYANTLIKLERFTEAFAVFEKAIQENPCDIHILRSYAKSLTDYGDVDKAFHFFEIALSINNTDSRIINDYSSLLIQYEKWSILAKINPHKPYFRLKYAQYLEREGDYESALSQLLGIGLATQKTYHANIIRLNLGRLYYRLGQIDLGKQFFEEAIANSDEQDKTILYAARSLLATNPNSQEAINLLRQIQEDSPLYAEAMKAIALNADEETSYELFGADEEQIDDIEMLYRAMYHKIGNEIAVLRSISYRLLRRMEGEHPLVKEIVNDFEKLQQGIASQRANEKAAIAGISHSNYKQLIEIVSKTAHDISDEVNNQLAVIESKTRRAMRKLTTEDSQYQQFEKLLLQLKITQKAINDLKSINEGKTIRRNRFLVHRLFEKWEPENWTSQPRIDGVRIRLDIRNPDSEFNGDEEKIKSILNELVENSLKHNYGNSNLSIRMYSSDLINPSDISSPTIPGDRKFLYIEFTDNGQGIPNDKKEWIFQPLKTTSPEDKGSGLGLFIARKTIKKMGGQIREVGEAGKGVRFQIYLPYLSSNALQ